MTCVFVSGILAGFSTADVKKGGEMLTLVTDGPRDIDTVVVVDKIEGESNK